MYPGWTISNLTYEHGLAPSSSPKGSNSTARANSLSFNLTSLSANETFPCVIQVDETTLDRTHTERWVACDSQASRTANASNITSTSILFNMGYSLLAVNQSWQCGPNASYNAVGFLDWPLNCTTGSSSYTCTLPTTNLTGYTHDDAPEMPHTYYTHSCTMNSVNVTSVTIKNYAYDSAAKAVSFSLVNPGPGDEYGITRMPVQDDGSWHSCVAGPDSYIPWQLVSCLYRLDAAGDIGLQFQWSCDDRDPEHAYVLRQAA